MVDTYEVGGCVRDSLMGIPSKDVDFVVVADSFDAMRHHLISSGFKIYVEKPEFLTIRANVPVGHPLRARTKDADFVLARKDSASGDGRRPDAVYRGSLTEDLARRDFTMNAVAKDIQGNIIDPFGGVDDIKAKLIRFVGNPEQRIEEDGLRVLRGFRFSITKGFTLEESTAAALNSEMAAEMLHKVSVERIRDEIEKMFIHNTLASIKLLSGLPGYTQEAIFRGGLRLIPTMKS